jgi:hypothetical protein
MLTEPSKSFSYVSLNAVAKMLDCTELNGDAQPSLRNGEGAMLVRAPTFEQARLLFLTLRLQSSAG